MQLHDMGAVLKYIAYKRRPHKFRDRYAVVLINIFDPLDMNVRFGSHFWEFYANHERNFVDYTIARRVSSTKPNNNG